jgi:hypothetical protein
MKKLFKIIVIKIKRKMGKFKIEIGGTYRVTVGNLDSTWRPAGALNGDVFTVKILSPKETYRYNIKTITKNGKPYTESNNGWVYDHELQPIEIDVNYISERISEIAADISKKQDEVDVLQLKLEFINKFGLKTFKEDEFKAYQVLKELGIDDIEKAKKIVSILS